MSNKNLLTIGMAGSGLAVILLWQDADCGPHVDTAEINNHKGKQRKACGHRSSGWQARDLQEQQEQVTTADRALLE